MIGFSIAMPAQLDGVRKAVEAIAREGAGQPRFILGGFPIRCGLKPADDLCIETLPDPLALVEALRVG